MVSRKLRALTAREFYAQKTRTLTRKQTSYQLGQPTCIRLPKTDAEKANDSPCHPIWYL